MPPSANYVLSMLPWFLATSFAGVLGALVTVQKRLQDPKNDGDAYYRYLQTSADWISVVLVPPVLGAVFGAVVYFLLVSNLVLGGIANWDGFTPKDGKTIAVLLIFGFLAGFAEQLVPDALTRIARRALDSEDKVWGPPDYNPREPRITGVLPFKGPASGGSVLEISGNGFSEPELEVKFGRTRAGVVQVASDTRLKVTSPAGSAGTVNVIVSTREGKSRPSIDSQFTYVDHAESS